MSSSPPNKPSRSLFIGLLVAGTFDLAALNGVIAPRLFPSPTATEEQTRSPVPSAPPARTIPSSAPSAIAVPPPAQAKLPTSKPATTNAVPAPSTNTMEPAKAKAVAPEDNETLTLHFDSGTAYLSPVSKEVLAGIVARMQREPGRRLLVVGHADEQGPHDENQGLSQRRTDIVVGYLVTSGIKKSRIQSRAVGESQPIASGHEASAWAQNRRVEMSWQSGEP